MPNPQKAKGSNWERDVARFLSDHYNESFIRSPGSGAYVGGINQKRKDFLDEGQIRTFKGDIVPGESFGHLNSECKFYKDFPFHQLFQGKNSSFDEWIEQCMDVADDGDVNILFMKFNNKGKYVALQLPDNKTHILGLIQSNFFQYQSQHYGIWLIMDFDNFFKLNSEWLKITSQKVEKQK